jgi:hypothetical protein
MIATRVAYNARFGAASFAAKFVYLQLYRHARIGMEGSDPVSVIVALCFGLGGDPRPVAERVLDELLDRRLLVEVNGFLVPTVNAERDLVELGEVKLPPRGEESARAVFPLPRDLPEIRGIAGLQEPTGLAIKDVNVLEEELSSQIDSGVHLVSDAVVALNHLTRIVDWVGGMSALGLIGRTRLASMLLDEVAARRRIGRPFKTSEEAYGAVAMKMVLSLKEDFSL